MAEIRLETLSFRYPGAGADTLTGLELAIARGEAHALLGASGTGKSTLVNLLSGLLRPSGGAVRFDGRDVSALPPRQRRVAQVFQFPVLYDTLTVEENLVFPLRNHGWRRPAARQRAAEIAARLGLTPWLSLRAGKLPLFHKQLVAIARALVRPDIALVLLDEPLTAVQPATKWELRQSIKAIQRELGATMVYVTHDQTEALTFADRISVMYGGAILQTGTPEVLYRWPDHEQVAHFIGSPGMNLLPARVEQGDVRLAGVRVAAAPPGLADGACTIGFRPEWAELLPLWERPAAATGEGIAATGRSHSTGLSVHVTATRVLGIDAGGAFGIVTGRLGEQALRTRQTIRVGAGDAARLELDGTRLVLFRDGQRVDDPLAPV